MSTVADDAVSFSALQELFDAEMRIDAKAVYRDMQQSPAMERMRAETDKPASFRLLALRSSRMSAARDSLRERMLAVAEHRLPLSKESQQVALITDIRRALESCLRVLESTDDQKTTRHVAETVEAMSHNIGTMSTLLDPAYPALANELAKASLRATEIAQNVDAIAQEMRQAYEQVRAELAKTGPRAAMHHERAAGEGPAAPVPRGPAPR